MTFQEINAQGLKHIAKIVETMAGAEQLDAHRKAMEIRRKSIENLS